ncbi:hypothetical protein ACH5RR_037445 [Cinchona calisaya]|uniref:Uncharacterized protein n=1 Tax=Cinchona calisaya TaxID=153742 RepID=A0ABD2Y7L1_9GENT
MNYSSKGMQRFKEQKKNEKRNYLRTMEGLVVLFLGNNHRPLLPSLPEIFLGLTGLTLLENHGAVGLCRSGGGVEFLLNSVEGSSSVRPSTWTWQAGLDSLALVALH